MTQLKWNRQGNLIRIIRRLHTNLAQAQADSSTTVALEAIAEGLDILHMKWINDSMSLDKLNELARALGYDDAQSVHAKIGRDGMTREYAMSDEAAQAEADRGSDWFLDVYKCYAKVGQLRRELTDTCAARDTAEAELRAERQLRQEAETAARIRDRQVGELAQATRTERQERVEYHGAVLMRAERAEALAQLVTPELAVLLISMANIVENYDYPKAAQEARELAVQIREALDEH